MPSYTIFNTISDLRSNSTSSQINSNVVSVLGYYTPGDNGAGLFTYNSSSVFTDDGGAVIQPSNISGAGRWIRQFTNNSANVQMWGTKGDGVTDDTPAIQNAINYCSLSSVPNLYFNNQTYFLSSYGISPLDTVPNNGNKVYEPAYLGIGNYYPSSPFVNLNLYGNGATLSAVNTTIVNGVTSIRGCLFTITEATLNCTISGFTLINDGYLCGDNSQAGISIRGYNGGSFGWGVPSNYYVGISSVNILNNTFINCHRAINTAVSYITGGGVQNLNIGYNTFLYPKGSDSANSNGGSQVMCTYPDTLNYNVYNNIAEGTSYVPVNSPNTYPKDGFIFFCGINNRIRNNTLSRFGVETLYVGQSWAGLGITYYPVTALSSFSSYSSNYLSAYQVPLTIPHVGETISVGIVPDQNVWTYVYGLTANSGFAIGDYVVIDYFDSYDGGLYRINSYPHVNRTSWGNISAFSLSMTRVSGIDVYPYNYLANSRTGAVGLTSNGFIKPFNRSYSTGCSSIVIDNYFTMGLAGSASNGKSWLAHNPAVRSDNGFTYLSGNKIYAGLLPVWGIIDPRTNWLIEKNDFYMYNETPVEPTGYIHYEDGFCSPQPLQAVVQNNNFYFWVDINGNTATTVNSAVPQTYINNPPNYQPTYYAGIQLNYAYIGWASSVGVSGLPGQTVINNTFTCSVPNMSGMIIPVQQAARATNAVNGYDPVSLIYNTVSGNSLLLTTTIPPVITLNGNDPLTVDQYSTFIDPGAIVTDIIDSSRTIYASSGTVDTQTDGTYTLTYTAINTVGLSATPVNRTVNVITTHTYGCTNPNALNYNPNATIDDGSCIIPGCTNPDALNYNPNATIDDGSCIIPTYITVTYPQTASLLLQGYMYDRLQNIYLSSADVTFPSLCTINAFSTNPLVSAAFPAFSGFQYPSEYYYAADRYSLYITLTSFPSTGIYDVILFNAAGYTKLSTSKILIKNIKNVVGDFIIGIDGSIFVTIHDPTVELSLIPYTPPPLSSLIFAIDGSIFVTIKDPYTELSLITHTPSPSPSPSPPLSSTNFVNVYSKDLINTISVSASNGNPVYPNFSTSIYDYCITGCGLPNSPINYTLFVNSSAINSGTTVANNTLQVFDGTNAYYIGFLPNGLPVAPNVYGPTSNYKEGYYLLGGYYWTMFANDQTVTQYYSIYNKYGVPVWFTPSLSADSVSLHTSKYNNARNRIVTNSLNGLPRYVIDLNSTPPSVLQYNLRPKLDGTTPWAGGVVPPQYPGWDIHESQELVDGSILAVAYTLSGFYIQIQNSNKEVTWEWDSSNYFVSHDASSQPMDFYHLNSVDIRSNSPTGDVLVSVRNRAAVFCITNSNKNIAWVLQGATTDQSNVLSASFLPSTIAMNPIMYYGSNILNEPLSGGFQYNGPICQHDARWHNDITSEYGYGSLGIISLYDDETTYLTYSHGNSSRAVIYELQEEAAYHRSSIFNTAGQSPYTGSHTITDLDNNNNISQAIDFSHAAYIPGQPILREYWGQIDDNNKEQVLALDFPGDNYYRIVKAPGSFFDIDVLRTTSGMYLSGLNAPPVPTIILNNSNPYYVTQYNTFTDPGAIVTDYYDAARTIYAYNSGAVDVTTIGTYTIIYSAVDTHGLYATPVSRTVNVTPFIPNILSSPSLVNIESPATITNISVPGHTLYPAFSSNYQDYVITTTSAHGQSTSYTLHVNGNTLSAGSINVDHALQVYDLSNNIYYVRFLNSNMPVASTNIYNSVNYVPGYYAVGGASDGLCSNLAIYNQYGIPIWYIPGHTGLDYAKGAVNNTLIYNVGPGGSGDAIITINSNSISSKDRSFGFDQHEIQQVSSTSPLVSSRNGNIIGFTSSGFTINEYTSAGSTPIWTWTASDYFNESDGANWYHVNSLDVHPTTGNILISMRNTSCVMCIEYATKNILWVLGNNTYNSLYANRITDMTTNTKWISGTNIRQEPNDPTTGSPYNGTAGNHDARWHSEITPLSSSSNFVISIFDDQTYQSEDPSHFTSGGHTARGVIYEVDPINGVAYHLTSIFAPVHATSPWRGSFTVLQDSNSYSYTVDFCSYYTTNNPQEYVYTTTPWLIEYEGGITSTKSKVFDFYVPVEQEYGTYRGIKLPTSFLSISALRATAGQVPS